MPAALKPRHISIDEYLTREQVAEVRHEYVDGEVVAMAGASVSHNRIAGNLFAALHSQLRGQPCEPFMADMKTRLKNHSKTLFYYPDVMVCCDQDETHPLYRERPTLVAEVLSPATERVDRLEKRMGYQAIESLQVYLLISQEQLEVIVYRRSTDWEPELVSPEGLSLIDLPELQCRIPLAEIYQRTDL